MRGRWLGLVLAAVVGLAAVGAKAADPAVLKVGIEGNYPPFSQKDGKGGWKGFDIDIAKALCERIKAKCQLVQKDWDVIQDALAKKEVDAIVASMSMTVSRRQRMDFTNRYYHTPGRFVAIEDAEIEVTGAGLAGRTIGVQAGTVHETFVRAQFGNRSQIVTFQTQAEGLKALKGGEVELFLGDAIAVQRGFLATKDGKGYAFIGPDFNDARWFGDGIGIAIRKEDQELRWKLNRALDEIRADGTYQKLSMEYFGIDIYGTL